MVRGELPGLRNRQDASSGDRFGDPAPAEVQEVFPLALRRGIANFVPHARISGLFDVRLRRNVEDNSARCCDRIICIRSHDVRRGGRCCLPTMAGRPVAGGAGNGCFSRGLEPDLSLPDLAIPGQAEKAPQQPEFVQTPSQYLRETSFDRLATRGKQLAVQYRDTLARIEKEFGVPGSVVLAIWGRETDYGGYQLPNDAIRVLATQTYIGKRKEFFQNEFLHLLKMLQDGVPRSDLRSSWGGAMGL